MDMAISLLIGFLAGLLGGLVGIGGGVIMIPLMVRFFKLGQHSAHGTSLVALVFTGLSGAMTYALKGTINLTASMIMAAGALITARAGARYAHSLSEWKLKRFFGGFLVFVSIVLLLNHYFPLGRAAEAGGIKIIVLFSAGILTGFFSGMMGVGGGTIMIPAMVLLAGFDQHTAQGSSLLTMVPAGGFGAYAHWRLGNVKTNLLKGLIPGILVGTALGGNFAHVLSDATLRIVFAIVLVGTGIRYLRVSRAGEDVE